MSAAVASATFAELVGAGELALSIAMRRTAKRPPPSPLFVSDAQTESCSLVAAPPRRARRRAVHRR